MGFSYDNTKLGESKLFYLRFLLQDTLDAGHYLDDEEINFIASDQPNANLAAARLARIIAANLARLPEINDPVLKINPQERAKQYFDLAKSFDKEAERAANSPAQDSASEMGGATISLFDQGSSLYSSNEPTFTRDMDFSI